MKKLSIILSTIVFVGTAYSQSAVLIKNIDANMNLAPNATVNVNTVANGNVKVNFDITNSGTVTTAYAAKRYDVLLNTAGPSQASAYFCFAGNCYGSFITTANGLTLTPGQSASGLSGQFNILTADLDEATSVGESIVKYTFLNENNPSDSVQITIRYNQATGIKHQSNLVSSAVLYPNPSSGKQVNLSLVSKQQLATKLFIYNTLGSIVAERKILLEEGKNELEITSEKLTAGVYFVVIRKEDLNLVTKRLIVE